MHRTWHWIARSLLALPLIPAFDVQASDWPRFRGPNGTGICADTEPAPTQWNETDHVKWKVALPGPGSSCPILIGDRIYVTCWTGYGVDRNSPGEQKDLRRHLLCLDRKTGRTIWDQTIEAVLPEDEFGGMFAEHGYASHTPVSDGENIYVFFGKSGVVGFTADGKKLWQTAVGTESDPRGWGSASSPILYKNLLLVTASAESEAMVAIDKSTGNVVWKKEAQGFGSTWGTPVLVRVNETRSDVVLGVPNEIWAFDPETGKMRWYCTAMTTDSFCSSVVADEQAIYAIEGRGGGSIAIRPGGEKDVTDSHIIWTGRDSNRIGTPLAYQGRLYFFANRIANCVDATSGKSLFQERLPADNTSSPAVAGPPAGAPTGPGGGPGGPGGRGGRGRGGMGGQDYGSPIAVDGKIYYLTRSGTMYVLKAAPTFEVLAVNRMTSESEDFSATPAASQGQLFIRSNKHLYCIGL